MTTTSRLLRRTPALLALALAATLAVPSTTPVAGAATIESRAATTRAITVGGSGVAMYPAFTSATTRYAVTTDATTAGTVTVQASTSDPHGTVRVDGEPIHGSTTLHGLATGDEVSVLIDDTSGHAAYSLFITPAGFPTLQRTTPDSGLGSLEPGLTFLTLGLFTPDTNYYETAVDANGVPVTAHEDSDAALDFKSQPDGHYSVARTTTEPGRTGWDVVELSPSFQPITSFRTVGLTNTDDHDSIFLPDGTHFLPSYEPQATGNLKDAVIQEIDPSGHVVFSWNSADHDGPAETMASAADVANNGDYAHMNSMQLLNGGQDLLVSFRHLSSVWLIAVKAHDGFASGDVEWRFGGRRSDFTFSDPTDATFPSDGTDGGPCAQHTATMLPNGHILIWDNGSAAVNPAVPALRPYCVSGTDKTAAAVPRPHTRAEEFAIDTTTHRATLVWKYDEPGRYAVFAGGVRRLDNGDSLLAWANDTASITDEVAADDTLLWSLRDANPDATKRQYTYRSFRGAVADWAAPVVTVTAPPAKIDQGASATVSFGCTDVGGSTLHTCTGSQTEGARLDTAKPGAHTLTVSATDGAGHHTTVVRHYTVLASSLPELSLKTGAGCRTVTLHNGGVRKDRIVLHSSDGRAHWKLVWRLAGKGVTAKVFGAGLSTTIAPGQNTQVCLKATPKPGEVHPVTLDLKATSALSGAVDKLAVKLHG